jgi:hypothetical protein
MDILASRKQCEEIQHVKKNFGKERCDRIFAMLTGHEMRVDDIHCLKELISIRNQNSKRFQTLYPKIPSKHDELEILFKETEQRIDTPVPLPPLTYDVFSQLNEWDEGNSQWISKLTRNDTTIRRYHKSDDRIERGMIEDILEDEDGMDVILWRDVKTKRNLHISGEMRDSVGPFRLFYKEIDRFVTVYNMETKEVTTYSLEPWVTPDRNGIVHDCHFWECNLRLGLLHTGEPYASNPNTVHFMCLKSLEEFCIPDMGYGEVAFDEKLVFFSNTRDSEVIVIDRLTGETKGKFHMEFHNGRHVPTRYKNGVLSCDTTEVYHHPEWNSSHVERRWRVDAMNIKRVLYLARAQPRRLPRELVKHVATFLCFTV